MVYYGGILVANSDLYHHGILGQKWGRRNGPPYPLSAGAHSAAEKKAGYQKSMRGGGGGGSYKGLFKKKNKTINNVKTKPKVKLTDEQNKKIENFTKKNVISSTQSTDTKRLDKAAELGIKALNEIGSNGGDPNDEDNKEWFLIEDQTIGLGAIADLVIQGNDKKQIEQLIQDAKELYKDESIRDAISNDRQTSNAIFELANAYDTDKFIDACIKINKESDQKFGSAASKQAKKQAKIRQRTKEKLAEIKRTNPEQYKKIKENTINTAKKASDIEYFVDDMDNTEIQYALDRLDKRAKLSNLSNKEVKTNWDKAKEVSEKLKVVADLTQNAANIYNNLNRISNNNQNQQQKKN